MASVTELVEEPALRGLAGTAAYERGADCAARGGVTLGDFGPLRVTARVADAQEVELRSTRSGLAWTCTCPEGQDGVFCEHAVAAALETWRRSPPRRR
jgi:uncharacterized Zn finger protein